MNPKKPREKCKNCGVQITGKWRGIFCSSQCCADYRYKEQKKEFIKNPNGASHHPNFIKKILFEIRGYRCESCGLEEWLGEKIPLELEHVDGNSENNSPENIKLLCPNCHALTPTYKSKNRGNGRFSRRKRYQEGKSY